MTPPGRPCVPVGPCHLRELLLGASIEGVEGSASTVGREGEEGATAGGGAAATSSVTTTVLARLPCSSWMSLPLCATSLLLLMSTRSLKLLRKSAPRMGKATGASRKVHMNYLVQVRTVHIRRPQQWRGLPSAVIRRGPVGSAEDLWGRMLKEMPESTRYCLELATSTR